MENNNLTELGLRSSKDDLFEKSDHYLKIYSNNVQMGISLWDMNLTFGEIVGEKDGNPIVEQKVKINLSKEFAKALRNLLDTNINQFEKTFGEIKIISNLEVIALAQPKTAKAPRRKKS